VGPRVASVLTESFGSIDALMAATEEELSRTAEIGPIIAHSVYRFLHSDYGKRTIKDLSEAGVQMQFTTPAAKGRRPLEGKTLVVTGTLERHTRDEIEELITRYGGRAASSVSRNTDYLVAGEKAGSKLAKAHQLGVKVISEDEFEKLMRG